MDKSNFEKIYEVVRQIPKGKVATYGQISRWLGWPRGARTVGWALRALPEDSNVPWHRIVNAQGHLSLNEQGAAIQRAYLETEGVVFDKSGRIDLETYGWEGPSPWEHPHTVDL